MASQSKPMSDQPALTHAPEKTQATLMESALSASFIASGIGSVILGLTIIGAETNAGIKTFLTLNAGVGPLGGKVILTVIGFFVSWGILHFVFRNRPMKLSTGFTIGVILVIVGLLLTFPPVFLAFGG